MISILSALLMIVSLISVRAAASHDLRALIDYAQEHSPSFKIAANELKLAQISKENAFAHFLPMLDLQTVQGFRDSEPESTQDNWGSSLELSLDAKLYDNGTNYLNYDQTKLELQKNKVIFKSTQDQLYLDISKEYFNYLLSFKLYNIQEIQYSFLKKKFDSIENQYKQGRKTRIEYLRFKSRLQRADLTKKQALNDQSKISERIKNLIGWHSEKLEIEIPKKQAIDLSIIPSTSPSFENHFLKRVSEIEREINYYKVKSVERKYWPELYLDTGVTYTNPDYIDDWYGDTNDEVTNWSALLTLKFNVFDWGIRKRNLVAAKISDRNFNYTNDNILLKLKSDLNILMLNLEQQKQNYILNRELENLEKGNFLNISNDYRNGKTSFLDLTESLDNYVEVQQASIRNFYELKGSLAEFYYHEGSLYEKINFL